METHRQRKLLSRRGVAGLAAGLVLAGLTAGGIAFAQEPTPEAGRPVDTFIQRLAGRLGIGEEQLTQAMKDTRNGMIDEAVAQGRLPAERAEQLKNHELGGLGHGPMGERASGMGHGRAARQFVRAEFEAIAQLLNLSATDLRAELAAGKSLTEVAQNQGVDRTTLVNQILADVQVKTSEAVANGNLTTEQAQKINDKAAQHVDRLVDAKHGAGMGGPRGRGQHKT